MPALYLGVFIWWCRKVTAVLSQCWAGLGPCGEHRSVLPQWLGSPSLPHFPKHSKWNPVTMTIVKVKGKGDASKGPPVTWQECTEQERTTGPRDPGQGPLLLDPGIWTPQRFHCPAFCMPCRLYRMEPHSIGTSVVMVVVCTPGLSATLSLTSTWGRTNVGVALGSSILTTWSSMASVSEPRQTPTGSGGSFCGVHNNNHNHHMQPWLAGRRCLGFRTSQGLSHSSIYKALVKWNHHLNRIIQI